MKRINIFLGGGVKLLHGEFANLKGYRNDVIDPVISQLNSQEHAKFIYVARDYSDLTRNVVNGPQQEVVYNRYVKKAHVALFVIDGQIGGITRKEIDTAVQSYRKKGHPYVFVYGINIKDDNEILEYLNSEGIYYQHFYDNRDLANKIKSDLQISTKKVEQKSRLLRRMIALGLITIAIGLSVLFRIIHDRNDRIVDSCSAQLYLMRYMDVNALTGKTVFNDSILDNFKYEDSFIGENDMAVFPVYGNDSNLVLTQPFFRVKLHNRNRNTIVFVESVLEVDQYLRDSNDYCGFNFSHAYTNIDGVDDIQINDNNSEYLLDGFRQSIAYGDVDDNYYFILSAIESCSFRMRIRAKTQAGEYLYSNYVYVKYII